ncbi:MAG: MFS transporter [Marmoricola sp.]
MAIALDRSSAHASTRARQNLALFALCGVLFLTFLDTTIASVALGNIQSDLHAGVIQLQWVVNGYSLVFASLMLMAGAIADRIGRHGVLFMGVVIFCAGSVMAATATTVAMLIAGRAVMGVGAAASETGTLAIIRQIYRDPRERARAIGIWVATAGTALALGPVIGGLLINVADWRAIFWFNLALGLVLLVVTERYVPRDDGVRAESGLDIGGFIFGAAFLACGAFAVIHGETAGYSDPGVITLFVICGVSLLIFVGIERAVKAPMIARSYLSRVVNSSLLVSFAMFFGVFSIFFFTALYLIEVMAYSGGRIAAAFAPMAVTLIGSSIVSGRWVARVGTRAPMVLGCLIAAVGVAATDYVIVHGADALRVAITLGIAGVGFGLGIVPATSAVLSEVPPENAGVAASMVNTSRQIGAVLGVAVLGSLVNSNLTTGLGDKLDRLGVGDYKSIVINAIESGQVPQGGSSTVAGYQHTYGDIVTKVISAAYSAFRSGLEVSLTIAAVVIALAAVVALFAQSKQRPELDPADPTLEGR